MWQAGGNEQTIVLFLPRLGPRVLTRTRAHRAPLWAGGVTTCKQLAGVVDEGNANSPGCDPGEADWVHCTRGVQTHVKMETCRQNRHIKPVAFVWLGWSCSSLWWKAPDELERSANCMFCRVFVAWGFEEKNKKTDRRQKAETFFQILQIFSTGESLSCALSNCCNPAVEWGLYSHANHKLRLKVLSVCLSSPGGRFWPAKLLNKNLHPHFKQVLKRPRIFVFWLLFAVDFDDVGTCSLALHVTWIKHWPKTYCV